MKYNNNSTGDSAPHKPENVALVYKRQYSPQRKILYGSFIMIFLITGMTICILAMINESSDPLDLPFKHIFNQQYYNLLSTVIDRVINVIVFLTFLLTTLFMPNWFSRKYVLEFTPTAIIEHSLIGTTIIPWTDVQRIGVIDKGILKFTGSAIGIRLKSYENCLMQSEEVNRKTAIISRGGRFFMLVFFAVPGGIRFLHLLLGIDKNMNIESTFAKLDSLASIFSFNRNVYGYDIFLSGIHIDVPPHQLVKEACAYYLSYAEGVNPAEPIASRDPCAVI